jgi:solute carrier family 23 (nucleobase transporter), member 1
MSSTERPNPRGIVYQLDDKPEFPKNVTLALQHVLTMFGSTVAVPLLLGPMMGMDHTAMAILVSSVMLCSGVATLLQVTFGSRLPIIQGVSFSFIAPFILIIEFAKNNAGGEDPGSLAMRYIAGAIMVGALFEIGVGFSGLMGKMRKFLSPVVVGPTIMMIGLALFAFGAPKAGTDWLTSGLTIGCIILFSQVLSRRYTPFKIFPILLAVLVGYLFALGGTLTGFFGEAHPSYVDLTRVGSAPWVRLMPNEIVFPWGFPKFEPTFLVAILAGYMASMIESYGDYHAAAAMAGAEPPTEKQVSRGIGMEGVACFCTGLLGGFSSTSYSENVGLIGITKVASRHVVQVGACILIFLGIFAKFGSFVSTIPQPIVGGLYCALFGLISAVGVQQLAQCDLNSDRNLMIAGFSMFMGLSLPAYFAGGAFSPGWADLKLMLNPQVAEVIGAVGSSGMAVAAILGLLLDNLIPGTDKERGLHIEPGEHEECNIT